ncbi:hypothetical protein CYMTET_30967 [Cymbomonas tetramitiformis]|uniref:Right handed beta helix domain-containing protein n=1 Tax=Cymbomonas tetramitiformis TaxID=36881 RepID=A0AAE0FJ95_9CHLO|nr:hypothetical protein CYMTET_30967 [Cymbomonas tetramitiformis]
MEHLLGNDDASRGKIRETAKARSTRRMLTESYVEDECPWLNSTTEIRLLLCNDGTNCKTDIEGWSCCTERGGRAKCPLEMPVMCAKANECSDGTDYCCDEDAVLCSGSRPCYPGCSDFSVQAETSCAAPTLWTDAWEQTCNDYLTRELCTTEGGYGSGWDETVRMSATFSDLADEDGNTALEACCTCGGGLYAPPPPPQPHPCPPPPPPSPPAPPPLPAAPPVPLDGATATLTNAAFASPQLVGAMQDSSTAVIILETDVALDESLPTIRRALHITGECIDGEKARHCEISGRNTFRIFSISQGGDIHLRSLALRYGFADASSPLGAFGGAVYIAEGGNFTANDCELSRSSATEGGAVYADGGRVALRHTTFAYNQANTDGSAIVASNGSVVWIDAGVVSNGTAGDECAVYVHTNSTLMITASNIVGNAGYAGTVCAVGWSVVTVSNGTQVRGNYVDSYAAGLMLKDHSQGVLSGASAVSSNIAGLDGPGGIGLYSQSQFRIFDRSNVSDNSATKFGVFLLATPHAYPITLRSRI